MEIIGKPPVHPAIFYTGKIAGSLTWIVLLLSLAGIEVAGTRTFWYSDYIAIILFAVGFFFSFMSLVSLGNATRMGLPTEKTALKTSGLYRLSRNPIYLGLNLVTIAAVVYTMNVVILLLGIYSIISHHLIIKGEEQFLSSRFGEEYHDYRMKVNRYI
jgi:protein-S-isoprenylcysteine O-methyltransferase Ste14